MLFLALFIEKLKPEAWRIITKKGKMRFIHSLGIRACAFFLHSAVWEPPAMASGGFLKPNLNSRQKWKKFFTQAPSIPLKCAILLTKSWTSREESSSKTTA